MKKISINQYWTISSVGSPKNTYPITRGRVKEAEGSTTSFISFTLVLIFFLINFQPSLSRAQDGRQEILTVANAIKFVLMTERGDPWIASLWAENPSCGKSSADRDYRARRLARTYEALVKATSDANVDAIFQAARNLFNEVHKSRMYESCWKTMKHRAELLAEFDAQVLQIIDIGSRSGTSVGTPPQILSDWESAPFSGAADIAVGPDGTIWVTGSNGTVWFSSDGTNFNNTGANHNLGRIAVSNGGTVWAVGNDGSVKRFNPDGTWYTTNAEGAADIAIGPDGKIWVTGIDGTLWCSSDASNWTRTPASGAADVDIGPDGRIWVTGTDGTVWFSSDGCTTGTGFTQTNASDMANIAVGPDGRIWLTGHDGTVSVSSDGSNWNNTNSSNFRRIDVGLNGAVWGVKRDSTVWKRR